MPATKPMMMAQMKLMLTVRGVPTGQQYARGSLPPEEREQDDDGERNPKQPEKRTTSKAHMNLRFPPTVTIHQWLAGSTGQGNSPERGVRCAPPFHRLRAANCPAAIGLPAIAAPAPRRATQLQAWPAVFLRAARCETASNAFAC